VTFSVVVRRGAKADVRSAARWYELQRPGLGREFVAEVDRALNRVAESPFQCQILHRESRRAGVHRFPYGVLYRIAGSEIIVYCVTHLHRDPAGWRARIEK
jgi:plasmid stabilization system protein ParE